ncbi:hypothetical protein [Halorubrum pallidum]
MVDVSPRGTIYLDDDRRRVAAWLDSRHRNGLASVRAAVRGDGAERSPAFPDISGTATRPNPESVSPARHPSRGQ